MVSIEHSMTSNQNEFKVQAQETKEVVVRPAEDEAVDGEAPESYVDPVLNVDSKRKTDAENFLLYNKPIIHKVKINGMVFSLKVLNSLDHDEIFHEAVKLSASEQMTKTSRFILAACLTDVDNVPVEFAYSGPDSIESVLLRKYAVVSMWPSTLVTSLNKAYQEIVKKSEEEFSYDFLD